MNFHFSSMWRWIDVNFFLLFCVSNDLLYQNVYSLAYNIEHALWPAVWLSSRITKTECMTHTVYSVCCTVYMMYEWSKKFTSHFHCSVLTDLWGLKLFNWDDITFQSITRCCLAHTQNVMKSFSKLWQPFFSKHFLLKLDNFTERKCEWNNHYL